MTAYLDRAVRSQSIRVATSQISHEQSEMPMNDEATGLSEPDDETTPDATPDAAAGDGGDVDGESIERLNAAYLKIREQMGRVIVGQDSVIEQLLIALFLSLIHI